MWHTVNQIWCGIWRQQLPIYQLSMIQVPTASFHMPIFLFIIPIYQFNIPIYQLSMIQVPTSSCYSKIHIHCFKYCHKTKLSFDTRTFHKDIKSKTLSFTAFRGWNSLSQIAKKTFYARNSSNKVVTLALASGSVNKKWLQSLEQCVNPAHCSVLTPQFAVVCYPCVLSLQSLK